MPDKNAPAALAKGIGLLFMRLFLGAVIVVVLLVVAMLSGFFGGGSKGLFSLIWIGIIATPVWSLVPLFRAIAGRGNASERSDR